MVRVGRRSFEEGRVWEFELRLECVVWPNAATPLIYRAAGAITTGTGHI